MSKVKRIKFRRSDFNRAILTDTLPYEVPLLFSNEGYYERVSEGTEGRVSTASLIEFFSEENTTIAYTYRIKKDAFSSRTLSVMHPAIQKKAASFYKQYSHLLIGLCSRSSFSLRRPFRVASHYYEKNKASRYIINDENVEISHDAEHAQQKTSSSFFTYKDYNLIHKFYESTEFHGLERRFKFLRTLDISKCFPHIYTHSISWAVRSKEFAKDNKGAKNTFDAQFDELMRLSNHDETNGILVGPETSRIFAEIILQRIDTEIQERLRLDIDNLEFGADYCIRRYVDDYFVFSNSDTILDKIERITIEELEKYKLYLNEAKSTTVSRPFLTGQTSAKLEIASIVEEFFSQHIHSRKEAREIEAALETTEEGHVETDEKSGERLTPTAAAPKVFPIRYVGNPNNLTSTYIRRIKNVIQKNSTSFDYVSNYFFSVIRKRTLELLERIDSTSASDKENERLSRFIGILLEIVFFVLSMSPRVRATYQVCQICLALKKFSDTLKDEVKDSILGNLATQLRTTILTFTRIGEDDNIEMLNLLTLLHSLGSRYSLTQEELCNFFGISINFKTKCLVTHKDFRYFQIVSLLHYIDESARFHELKDALHKHVIGLFESIRTQKSLVTAADMTMLLFDFLRCPYVEKAVKVQVAKKVLKLVSDDNVNARSEKFLEAVDEGDWFFGWSSTDLLGAVLWKKELRTAY
ncbi:UNVERIFIED_ORG: reverse transcriptase (RNA-dependent DNA polymerase) [Zoogloea ramigera]|uniref:Antiviral reverse transcriptase Drt3b n=1 Tax=Duganella zoogloeoides TaxID=75659 RepID=A0ABZ0XZY2_9BURK|nr:antiviral reverse transcriptase Drt3b [Duganella zoogloeoides]WQH05335.1 antiviral reverse transcriptase Drt3b [Duganella zoogloeoides]